MASQALDKIDLIVVRGISIIIPHRNPRLDHPSENSICLRFRRSSRLFVSDASNPQSKFRGCRFLLHHGNPSIRDLLSS
jgi:hypothetical protein